MSGAVAEGRVPARVLLVGCGKLGTRLGERLVRKGAEVVALRRDLSALPESFTRIAADLTSRGYEIVRHSNAHLQITFRRDDGLVDGYIDIFTAFFTPDEAP